MPATANSAKGKGRLGGVLRDRRRWRRLRSKAASAEAAASSLAAIEETCSEKLRKFQSPQVLPEGESSGVYKHSCVSCVFVTVRNIIRGG